MTILALQKKFDALNAETVSRQAVDASSEAMGKTIAKQMEDGKNGTGEIIGKYKNPAYARKKNTMNPRPGYGNVDLKYTGRLHRGIYVDVQGDTIRTESTVSYARKNEEKYGPQIYKLGGKYRIEYVKVHLRPEFQREITKATGLKFKP